MNILVTGANGFLGSHIVETALSKGHQVTALIRKGSDLSNLSHLRGLQTVDVNYSTTNEILSTLELLPAQDLIIHNAGLTKSFTLDQYLRVNVELTQRLIDAIEKSKHFVPKLKFAHISSLAARGPVGNGGPASNYGISKARAEEVVKSSRLNYVIFRPTGIYGMRDVQFVPLIKAAKFRLYPAMTSKSHKMTLINAKDAAENIIECAFKHDRATIHLEDGHVYEHKDLKKILETILQKKTINLSVSKPIVQRILSLSDIIDKGLKRTPKLSREHYSEISQDWNYDMSEERKQYPLHISYSLEAGFREAVDYYRSKNLI